MEVRAFWTNSLYFVKEPSPKQVVSFLGPYYKIKQQYRSSADKLSSFKSDTDYNQKTVKKLKMPLEDYYTKQNKYFFDKIPSLGGFLGMVG